MTYKPFDVVKLPFPFTDSSKNKRRPALVLSSAASFNDPMGHSVLAMITSAKNKPWALDAPINDLNPTGLKAESVVRMKIFTLDHRFILDKLGALSEKDQVTAKNSLNELFKDIR